MIDKLLVPVLEVAGKAVVKGATALGQAVVEHFTKHGTKYLIGGGAAAVDGAAYAVGKSVGHTKGKKKVQPNKLLVMKRNSRICTNDTRKIVSAGMKKNRLIKICQMKKKINYNYGIQTTNKERIDRRRQHD